MASERMKLKDMRDDRNGYMMNIGIGMIVGYILIAASMLSFYLISNHIMTGGIVGQIYELGPVLFGTGLAIAICRWVQDPKIIIILAFVGSIAWFILFGGRA